MVTTRSNPKKDSTKGKQPMRELPQENSPSYENPSALGSDGESQALREEGGSRLPVGAKDIARYLEIQRPIDWNQDTGVQAASTGKQRTALVLQRRGDIAQPACSRCEQGPGVFGSCVVAPSFKGTAFQRGSCANCIWDGKERSCSLRGDSLPLDAAGIRQSIGDGKSLRAVIQEEVLTDIEPSEAEVYVDEMDGGSSDKENVGSFFHAFKPDRAFARVGTSQHGPRCHFDGIELKFPISRDIWKQASRLLTARSDLAHFVSIVDARLCELGYGDSDAVFWEKEARRMARFYKPGRKGKDSRRALAPHPTSAPPPNITISTPLTPSPPPPPPQPHPTPQTDPRSADTKQASTSPSQRLLGSTNTQTERLAVTATSSRDRSVWDRPQSPDDNDSDQENRASAPASGPGVVKIEGNWEETYGDFVERPAGDATDEEERERERRQQAAVDRVSAAFTAIAKRVVDRYSDSLVPARRTSSEAFEDGPDPGFSKRPRTSEGEEDGE